MMSKIKFFLLFLIYGCCELTANRIPIYTKCNSITWHHSDHYEWLVKTAEEKCKKNVFKLYYVETYKCFNKDANKSGYVHYYEILCK